MARQRNLASVFLLIANVITVLIIMYIVTNLYNMQPKFTFMEPANAPGQLIQKRWTDPFWWTQIIAVVTRITLILATAARLAAPRNKWYPTFQIIAGALFIIVEIILLIFYFIIISGCNNDPFDSPSGIDNVCNDYRWCCVHGTIDPAPTPATIIQEGCPLLLVECSPAVIADDLKWNFEFTIGFSFGFVLFFLGILHIILGILMGDGRMAEEDDDEEEDEEFIVSNVNNNNNINNGVYQQQQSYVPQNRNNSNSSFYASNPFVINNNKSKRK